MRTGSGMLRQHFKADWRLSGIITKGGFQTGLVPELSEIEGSMSCFNLKELNILAERVRNCAILEYIGERVLCCKWQSNRMTITCLREQSVIILIMKCGDL